MSNRDYDEPYRLLRECERGGEPYAAMVGVMRLPLQHHNTRVINEVLAPIEDLVRRYSGRPASAQTRFELHTELATVIMRVREDRAAWPDPLASEPAKLSDELLSNVLRIRPVKK
jgi:hypothetical protein